MRKTEVGASVRRGLLKQGFGRTYVNRVARELEEHWVDLVNEGLRQGLAQSEAETHATNCLGTAEPLIEEFTARMQRSSWLGRHPAPGFALLALIATIVWWALLIVSIGSAAGMFTWVPFRISGKAVSASFECIRWASYFALPWFLCSIARRFHCGWKAALRGCLVLSVHNAMHRFNFSGGEPGHGAISWGYSFNFGNTPAWLPVFLPLGVFLIDLLWNSRPECHTDRSKNAL